MSSEHDRAVLNSIFNPYLPLGEGVYQKDLIGDDFVEEEEKEDGPAEEIEKSKKLEIAAVLKTEKGDINGAMRLFSEAIDSAPTQSSCYNNRAQAYRLQENDEAALMDLQTAIELSGGRGKSASQALCQRGLLYLKQGLDNEAKQDFQAAAALGSNFAKEQLVRLNPYAAMCNQMLNKMLKTLQQSAEPVCVESRP